MKTKVLVVPVYQKHWLWFTFSEATAAEAAAERAVHWTQGGSLPEKAQLLGKEISYKVRDATAWAGSGPPGRSRTVAGADAPKPRSTRTPGPFQALCLAIARLSCPADSSTPRHKSNGRPCRPRRRAPSGTGSTSACRAEEETGPGLARGGAEASSRLLHTPCV